jgi:membrane protein implicated in regulation of membrane protease activity
VKYRNTQWDAVVDGEPDLDQGQVLFIHAVDGNTLKVAKRKP